MTCHTVMAGLDPAIHEAARQMHPYRFGEWIVIMDRRVKPGDDAVL